MPARSVALLNGSPGPPNRRIASVGMVGVQGRYCHCRRRRRWRRRRRTDGRYTELRVQLAPTVVERTEGVGLVREWGSTGCEGMSNVRVVCIQIKSRPLGPRNVVYGRYQPGPGETVNKRACIRRGPPCYGRPVTAVRATIAAIFSLRTQWIAAGRPGRCAPLRGWTRRRILLYGR